MISIILPVYNVELFVDKSIKSILNQTFKEFELIVINDGSTDSSLKICKKYLSDKRVRIYTKENGGLSSARNKGLEYVKYPYVTFIDSDDWVNPNYLDELYNKITLNNADIAICGYSYVFTDEKKKIKTPKEYRGNKTIVFSRSEAISALFAHKKLNNFTCCKLFKTELFEDLKFPIGRFYEDIYTTYLLFDKSKTIVLLEKSLYNYLQHSGSITASISAEKSNDFFKSVNQQFNYFNLNKKDFSNENRIKFMFLKRFYIVKKKYILSEYNNKVLINNEKQLDIIISELLKDFSLFIINPLIWLKAYLSVNKKQGFKKYYLNKKVNL